MTAKGKRMLWMGWRIQINLKNIANSALGSYKDFCIMHQVEIHVGGLLFPGSKHWDMLIPSQDKKFHLEMHS